MSLVIDDYPCDETAVETLVPQGAPVSLPLFAIYLCRVFWEVKTDVEGHMATSFVEDCK